jgi:hypothetical protein
VTCALGRILRPHSGIYVTNASSLATDDQVRAWTAACAVQLERDVAPYWKRRPVRVQFLDSPDHAPKGSWVIGVLDDSDQAGALGWHTDDNGRVFGRVFVRPCQQFDVPPSTTLSHEIVETFCDPRVDRWADSGEGWSTPVEACDAVESGSYEINGVAVSDFLFPRWFRPGARGAMSFMGAVSEPFTLAAGGYMVRRFPDGTEDQVFGDRARRGFIAAKRSPLSRTVRRTGEARRP